MHLSFSPQWLRLWFPSKTKLKVRDARKGYAIRRPEPLLTFALCSGSYSDPVVDFCSLCIYCIFVYVEGYV